MFLKKSKVPRQLFFLVMVPCLMCPLELLAVDSNVRIEMARATRLEAFARWADGDTLVIGTHFGTPTAGIMRPDGEGYRFDT